MLHAAHHHSANPSCFTHADSFTSRSHANGLITVIRRQLQRHSGRRDSLQHFCDMHHQQHTVRQRSSFTAHALGLEAQSEAAEAEQVSQRCKICTIVTASSVDDAIAECAEAATCGADIVELRLDYLDYFDPTVIPQHSRNVQRVHAQPGRSCMQLCSCGASQRAVCNPLSADCLCGLASEGAAKAVGRLPAALHRDMSPNVGRVRHHSIAVAPASLLHSTACTRTVSANNYSKGCLPGCPQGRLQR